MKSIDYYNREGRRYFNVDGASYKNFQRTKLWKTARAELMRIRKVIDKCEACGRSATTLYMHHNKYDFDKIFDPANIIFLCRKCNARKHYKKWTQ